MAESPILIVGQGLAGSLLAWELVQAGFRVLVVDDGHKHGASSPAAAGIINPLAGKRFALYPETPEILQKAETCYATLKKTLGYHFFHPLPLRRFFQDTLEEERFNLRRNDPLYLPWIESVFSGDDVQANLDYHPATNRGGFLTRKSGWLDVPGVLRQLGLWLNKGSMLIHEPIEHRDFMPRPQGVSWKGKLFRCIIFCEGWRVSGNPWFQHLPWDPVRGDILKLKIPGLDRSHILNAGKWITPHSDDTFRAGATYRRDNLHATEPDPQDKGDILDFVRAFLPHHPHGLLEHLSGIRPGTRTQHPLLGAHPDHPGLMLFNGFGSKGAFLIPYFARLFKNWLGFGIPLPKRVDIQQRWKL